MKTLNILLWIAQVLVGAMFIMGGFMKLATPIEELSKSLPWTGEVSPLMVRGIGFTDLFCGLGLLLPSLLRIQPFLTPLAAKGGMLTMVAAAIFHISRGETSVIGLNIVLLALLAFINWGRSQKMPIAVRTS